MTKGSSYQLPQLILNDLMSVDHYYQCHAGADSDGETGPMMHLSRGFHALRSGSAYGRGHMGVNPSFPLGYGRGDASAAWEVMSDEGRGTGMRTLHRHCHCYCHCHCHCHCYSLHITLLIATMNTETTYEAGHLISICLHVLLSS